MANQLRFDSNQNKSLDLEGRVPPQNLEAERSLLGCILLMSESLDEVGEIIHADHFYSDAHQKIFRAAQELYEKGARGIDAVTVAEVLANKNHLEDVGGTPYLVDLMEVVPHAAHSRYYANIVREKWLQRNLIYSCTEVLKECYDSSVPVADLLGQAEASIFRILESQNMAGDIDLRDILLSAWDRVNDRMLQTGKITGLQTGFYDFDVKTSGLQAQELVILAARPSMGKTALVCNMAEGIARLNQKFDEDGKPAGGRRGVLMFSLEQSNLELAERLMCIRAKVDAGLVRSGEIRQDKEAQDKLLEAINELNEMPVFIDDQPGRNMMQISTIARRLKRRMPDTHKCDLGVIIIDYLQLIEPEDKRAPREQQISAISRRLKFMAKELDVPVIALSQLNRGVELREDKRPRLSDLRESGAIEQDADLIMFLHRPEQYDPEDRPGEADLIVAKHRSGPTGMVTLTFRKKYMRFEDYVNRDVDEAAFGHPQSNFGPPPDMEPPPNFEDPGLNTRF